MKFNYNKIESVNRIYGMRAALRESDMFKLDVRYQQNTGNLECYEDGILVHSFKAN